MKTLTPTQALSTALVSPEVAKLLHKLQGQIIKEAAAQHEPAAFAPPAAPVYTRHAYNDADNHRVIESSDKAGNEIRLQTPHLGNPERDWSKPGIWYGHETRVDAQGRKWRSSLASDYVVDDFGDLVAVQS